MCIDLWVMTRVDPTFGGVTESFVKSRKSAVLAQSITDTESF